MGISQFQFILGVAFSFFKSIKEVLRMSDSSFYHSGNHCLCMENSGTTSLV